MIKILKNLWKIFINALVGKTPKTIECATTCVGGPPMDSKYGVVRRGKSYTYNSHMHGSQAEDYDSSTLQEAEDKWKTGELSEDEKRAYSINHHVSNAHASVLRPFSRAQQSIGLGDQKTTLVGAPTMAPSKEA